MLNPAHIKFVLAKPILFFTLCIGALMVAVLLNVSMVEIILRSLAFTNLSKFFSQPALTLDESFYRSSELFDRLSAYDPARYAPYQLRLQGLADIFGDGATDRADVDYPEIDLPSLTADEVQALIGTYLRTVGQGSAQIREESIRRLATLLDTQVESGGLGRQVYTDRGAAPSLLPAFDRCPAVELASIYVDEQRIALRKSVPIVIVWRLKAAAPPTEEALSALLPDHPDWVLRRQGGFLFQTGVVNNQLPDGGFEQTVLPRMGVPSALYHSLYARQTTEHTQFVYEFPSQGQNVILRLDGQGNEAVGLGSQPFLLPSPSFQNAYLVTGRYRTDGAATPRIGIRWLLKDAQRPSDNVSSYVVRQASDVWTLFAGIVPSHPIAEFLQYWVLNADPSSQLDVDNLGLFPIPLLCPTVFHQPGDEN